MLLKRRLILKLIGNKFLYENEINFIKKQYMRENIYVSFYREMCSSEDVEVQTSALKLRHTNQQYFGKSF